MISIRLGVFASWMALVAGFATAYGEDLVVYSGRSKSLVDPLIERFREETGINVTVRYGNTPQLALAIRQEGRRSPADIFWAQDASGIEMLADSGLLRALPAAVTAPVLSGLADRNGFWVPTSGRARVLAYSTTRVPMTSLPTSVFELTDSRWRGRVGWAPANASFQAFVTAMRSQHGETATRDWLLAMKQNQTKVYPKNSPILQAIAAGEIDLGLVNHYYLLGIRGEDPDVPIGQTFFRDGDMGNLLFTAAAGVLASSRRAEPAERFLKFLLQPSSQRFFTDEVNEYPVIAEVKPADALLDASRLEQTSPEVSASELGDLDGTLRLLRELDLF